MNKKPNTRRALVLSCLSLLLCISMLIGSTFAWFTDTASTKVSNIVSGTLDIELLDGNTDKANSLEGETLTFAKAEDAPEDEKVLFEPGARYALQQVWLHNAGNLNAKYQVVISGIDGSAKLAEVLDVYIKAEGSDEWQLAGNLKDLVSNGGVVNSSVIAPNAYYSFGNIALEMQTTAGNDYQGLTMEGIAITVAATQAAVEYDSFAYTYDENAVMPIVTKEQLDDALADENVTDVLIGGGSYYETVTFNKNVISDGGTFDTSAKKYTIALDIESGADVVLNKGTYANAGGAVQIIDAQESGGKLTINGGNYSGGAAVWVREESDVEINGGTFNTWALVITDAGFNNPVIVNGGNFTLGNGGIEGGTGADIIINGGTFNVDPSNWVGEGHTATNNGDGTWTVK